MRLSIAIIAAVIGSFPVAAAAIACLRKRRPFFHLDLPDPYTGPSSLEKNGFALSNGAATNAIGRDWQWVLGQYAGREYWTLDRNSYADRVQVRRKVWPIAILPKGTFRTEAGETTGVTKEDVRLVWHVWGIGDSTKLLDGLCWGWGGSVGAFHNEDEFVIVNGKREFDGTSYRPSDEDIAATDWERV